MKPVPLISLLVLLCATVSVVSAEEYVPTGTWGDGDSAKVQLGTPLGIAVDRAGNVYVAEYTHDRIKKFSPDGTVLADYDAGKYPNDVAVDRDGNIYIANYDGVLKLAPDGSAITKWGAPKGDSHFMYLQGIEVDAEGNVYIAEMSANRVLKYTSNGELVTQWGNTGNKDGRLTMPRDIAVDSVGNVYVADNDSVLKFGSDGSFIKKWDKYAGEVGQTRDNNGITVDSAGNVFVTDATCFREFASDGTLIGKWGNWSTEAKPRNWATDIAVDSKGTVYVTENGGNRVQTFARVGGAAISSAGATSRPMTTTTSISMTLTTSIPKSTTASLPASLSVVGAGIGIVACALSHARRKE